MAFLEKALSFNAVITNRDQALLSFHFFFFASSPCIYFILLESLSSMIFLYLFSIF